MTLDLLLTQQVSVLTGKTGSSGKPTDGSFQDVLFGNLLQSRLITDVKTIQPPIAGVEENVALEEFDLAQSILALESALFDLVQSKLDSNDIAEPIQISLENIDKLNIDPDLQVILKAYLLGHPLPPATGKIEISTQKSTSILEQVEIVGSAFQDTDDLTTTESLFEKILGNVLQKLEIKGLTQEQLAATGLSVEQINTLTLKIRTILDNPENIDSTENLQQNESGINILELLSITLAAPEKDLSVSTNTKEDGILSDDLIALLGLMTTPVPQQQPPITKPGLSIESVQLEISDESGATLLSRFEKFQAALKANVATGQSSNAAISTPATQGTTSSNILTPATGGFSTLMSTFSMDTPQSSEDMTQQWLTPAGQIPSALGQGNATSLITTASHATAASPATQLVAVSIQKNAANGETKNWTLQLDPPELGRIEVRLNFSKDKTLKTHMVIEKPETWLMLQRDAHVLERALQEAGMESGGNSISFELARDNEHFGQDRQGNEQSAQNGNAGNEDDLITIETTMNWYVDANSGVQRYNLIA